MRTRSAIVSTRIAIGALRPRGLRGLVGLGSLALLAACRQRDPYFLGGIQVSRGDHADGDYGFIGWFVDADSVDALAEGSELVLGEAVAKRELEAGEEPRALGSDRLDLGL